ncbi:hypothetical protein GE061_014662 [Apolygus lucorum]|uniref:Insulin-degrading enzyme n=1 Tax=Apolygus lucorum TaxID=248454 RepID=A0A8S9XIN9_APOLU|nr:hypothetical protein GE061_014662 [Apolygus lucorum]
MAREKWDDIIKASTDTRSYRVVECNNELKAALVSDPNTDKAAVAMTVQVGSSADPDDLQGLAHFLEHMLFLGSEKYPAENDYKKFLIEHAGAANASTSLDKTTFYLTVAPEFLEGAMDRFSQFFISPLLSPDATEREVNAVSMEFERNRKIDRRRLMRLERWLCKMGHPYQKFSTGNRKLLDTEPRSKGINVREELMSFHDRWYSANVMTLAVVGSESLDDLEDKFGAFFSSIKNKNVEPYFFKDSPYQKDDTGIIYFTSPIKNRMTLTVMFPCPDYKEQYASGPVDYMKLILECCSKGSLYSIFRGYFWIDGKIEVGLQVITKQIGKFYIRLRITEEGLAKYEEIVGIIFEYLNMLRAKGPQQSIFDECAQIAAIQFEHSEKPNPQVTAITLSEKLISIPHEDILISDYKLKEWNPHVITDLMNHLVPNNVRIRLVGRKFENMLHDEDPIYGVKYKLEKIKPTLLSQWSTATVRKDFLLPAPNHMIPNDFSLVPREYPVNPKPVIAFESKVSRLWYLMDNHYMLPTVCYSSIFYLPCCNESPLASNLTFLVLSTMEDVATVENWHANVAGMSLKIEKTQFGFQFCMKGFSQRIVSYVTSVLKIGTSLHFTTQDLNMRKEILRRMLTNKEFDTPVMQSDYYLRMLTQERKWTIHELIDCIDSITLNMLENFYNKMTAESFTEGLIYGNISRKEAEECWMRRKDYLPRTPVTLSPNQMRAEREIVLPLGVNLLFQKNEEVHTSSCTTVYFHLGPYSLYSAAVAELFYQYIKEPVFSVLRTREQLAYKVYRGIDRTSSCLGLFIRLLTEKHPRYVDDRIEILLNVMGSNLVELPPSEFETHRESLINDKQTEQKKLILKNEELLSEIRNRHYMFDRKEKEVSIIKSLTKENLVEFYNDYIKPLGSRRRKLSIFILSSAGEYGAPVYTEDSNSTSYEEINDIVQFKNSCYTFPLLYVTGPRS